MKGGSPLFCALKQAQNIPFVEGILGVASLYLALLLLVDREMLVRAYKVEYEHAVCYIAYAIYISSYACQNKM